MGQESLIRWDMRRWLDRTREVVYGSGEFDWMEQEKMTRWDRRSCIWVRRVWEDNLMGQEKLILHENKTIFWQQMSHFHLCEDDCYQNRKVIVTKNLRWNYHLAIDEKWPNHRGMAARYWISHQYHLAFYFWCNLRMGTTADAVTSTISKTVA